jgi:phospholipase/carboxylesterase
MTSELEAIEVETASSPTGTVIWLHGLGADGHDFEPVVPHLVRPGERALRFVFPHAPQRPVSLNNGYVMRAWYDIVGLDRHSREDEAGIRRSAAAIRALIEREKERGIAAHRIVLAGFSQGGALALYTATRLATPLAGIIALSSYLVLASSFEGERTPESLSTPIFMAHGVGDTMVDLRWGEEARRHLETAGYVVEWHAYRMGHEVCAEEIAAIAAWLRQVL